MRYPFDWEAEDDLDAWEDEVDPLPAVTDQWLWPFPRFRFLGWLRPWRRFQ